MLAMSPGPYDGDLGFSLNPIKAVKSAAKAVGKGVVATGKGAVGVTKTVGKGTYAAGKAVGKGTVKVVKTAGKVVVAPFAWLGSKLTAPIRSRVNKLKGRRAAKLAWDKRKSKTPNAAENAEATAWTKGKLKSSGPHGHVLALFAGAPAPSYFGTSPGQLGIDPGTASVIAASIPVLIAVLNAILNKSAASGEAPANPAVDQQAEAQAAMEAQAAAMETPGSVDMTEMQDQMVEAAGEVEAAMPPPAGMVRLPGIRTPVKQSHVLIGGMALGGVLLLVLLTRRKD
jgi:hypothetical protein